MNKTAVMVLWSSSDDWADADFALLEIDPEYAQVLLRRMDVAAAGKAQDESLYALTFWSDLLTLVYRGALPDELADQVAARELVILDHSLEVPDRFLASIGR